MEFRRVLFRSGFEQAAKTADRAAAPRHAAGRSDSSAAQSERPDLLDDQARQDGGGGAGQPLSAHHAEHAAAVARARPRVAALRGPGEGPGSRLAARHRSEEHTSELQSLMRISYAVFCLKKKKKPNKTTKKQYNTL